MDLLAPFQTDAQMSFTMQLVWVIVCLVGLALAVKLVGFPRRDRKITEREPDEEPSRTKASSPPTGQTSSIHERTLKRIAGFAGVEFGIALNVPIAIQPTIPSDLEARINASLHPTPNLVSFAEETPQGWVILVQDGLDDAQLFAAAAHEFGHIWQREEGFFGGDYERKEGIAEWVTCKLTSMAGHDYDALQREELDELAASGMRKLFVLEERFGTMGVVKAMKSNQLDLKALR